LGGRGGRGSGGQDGGHTEVLHIFVPHPKKLLDVMPEIMKCQQYAISFLKI
jgi:hypothetical protein